MTISSTTTTKSYTGNGSTVAFPTTFAFFGTTTAAELDVVERVIATGVETTLTNGTHYTVSGGSGATGTVTAATAPAATVEWHIRRATQQTQSTDYVENDPFPATSHENALDRLTMIAQEQQSAHTLTFTFPDTYTGGASTIVPEPSTRKALVWNVAANALENSVYDPDAEATAAAASAVAAATAQGLAETAQTAAEAAQTGAELAETNAGNSETAAAASAATALASTVGKYQSVIALTSVDSPYTLGAITENTLLNVTTTGGSVIINLPASAGLPDGILVGVNKIGSTNTVTVNPNGADTIGGAASFVQYDDTEWSDLYLNKTITDWQLGNLSFTSAGTGLEKTGSTIGIAAGGVDTTQLADDAVDPTKAVAGVNAQTGTTYTYALTDNLKTVAHSNGSAIAATIPTNASVAFTADETRIDIMNEGAGDLTVSGDTGVTVNGVSAGSFTVTQYQGATIIKRGTDTWLAPNQTVA